MWHLRSAPSAVSSATPALAATSAGAALMPSPTIESRRQCTSAGERVAEPGHTRLDLVERGLGLTDGRRKGLGHRRGSDLGDTRQLPECGLDLGHATPTIHPFDLPGKGRPVLVRSVRGLFQNEILPIRSSLEPLAARGSRGWLTSARVLPLRRHLFARFAEMDVRVDVVDPGERDEVMLTLGCRIVPGQLDLVGPLHVIDGSDMLAIGGFDLHVLLDVACIDHDGFPLTESG